MRRLFSLFSLALMVGCTLGDSPLELGQNQQALEGTGVQDVTTSTLLPEALTGALTRPGAIGPGCNALVVLRSDTSGVGVLLTAAHCFCPVIPSTAFDPPTTPYVFAQPGGALRATTAFITTKAFGGPQVACSENASGIDVSDLAMVLVNRPFTIAETPQLVRVYTGADFPDRFLNSAPIGFNGLPTLVTGGIPINGRIQQGDVTNLARRIEPDCLPFAGFPFATCRPPTIRIDREQGLRIQKGDSGGHIAVRTPNGVVIFGTISAIAGDDDAFSPTWDNGNGNGAFIRSFFTDADEDGVDDAVDNCPPSRCADDPFRCSNPDQADLDGDGVGDACDNCAPGLCTSRGQSALACANSDQFDLDRDGVGDACDSCLAVPNADQSLDRDNDGVGDACDNCRDIPNARRPCRTDSDCGGQRCYQAPHLKACTTTSERCASDSDCGGIPGDCVLGFGRCGLQEGDRDRDGIGDACDVCPDNSDTRVNANSNIDAERRKNVSALGDSCDPVPQLVSKAIAGVIDLNTRRAIEPLGSSLTYTTFMGTAGLGVGGTTTASSERAGFRYCDCIDGMNVRLDRAMCATTQCMPTDSSYDTAGGNYFPITTTTRLGITTLPPQGVGVQREEFTRLFTTDVQCNDDFPHRTFSEQCRVGAQQHITLWEHALDPIRRLDGRSSGLFMSHVIRTTIAGTSVRDLTPGLRDTLEYVETPFVELVPPQQNRQFVDCRFAGCMMHWRPDWIVRGPDDYREQVTPLDLVAHYGRFMVQGPSVITVLGKPTNAEFDVSASIAPDLQTVMRGAGNVTYLSPVEEGTRGSHRGTQTPFIVLMPQPWRQDFVRPVGLTFFEGRLETVGGGSGLVGRRRAILPAAASLAPTSNPFGPATFIPGDRDESRAVFSGSEGSVYLVGGRRGPSSAGALTGEVWRYDMGRDQWDNQFLNVAPTTLPGDVRAIAYDESRRRILVIDDGVPLSNASVTPVGFSRSSSSTSKKDGRHRGPVLDRSRVLVIDLPSKTIRVVAMLKKTDRFARTSLIHQGNGEYLLLRGSKHGHSFTVRSLSLSDDGIRVRARRNEKVKADLLDDPIRTPEGIVVPVLNREGQHDMITLRLHHSGPHHDLNDDDEDDD